MAIVCCTVHKTAKQLVVGLWPASVVAGGQDCSSGAHHATHGKWAEHTRERQPSACGWRRHSCQERAAVGHPFYAGLNQPLAHGFEDVVEKRGANVAFHRSEYRPANSTLLVVGALKPDDVLPLLETHFGKWQAAGARDTDRAPAPEVRHPARQLLLVDVPEAPQSRMFAGGVSATGATTD